MLDVVVHVQVQEPEHRVHVHRARVQSVIEHVLAQPGVLREAEEQQQPDAVERRQADEEQRHDRSAADRPDGHCEEHGDVGPCFPHDAPPLGLRHEVACGVVDGAERVADHAPQHRRTVREVEHIGDERAQPERTLERDLRIATYDDRVRVVTHVRPAPQRRFTQQQERRERVHDVVRRASAEGAAVPALVPAGVGSTPVERAVHDERGHRPPVAKTAERHEPGAGQERQPQRDIARRPRVGARHQHL